MRSLLLGSLFGAALLFCAPGTAAAQEARASQNPGVMEEAPVDYEAERLFCPRRVGVPSSRRAVRTPRCAPSAVAESRSFGAPTCAVLYGYRGHRRLHWQAPTCQPLLPGHST